MWDPSSQAKDWNCVPCIGSPKLNHWTTREVPETLLLSQTFWCIHFFWVSSSVKQCPDGSAVKNPPAVQETRVPCLGQEDPLEEEMANPSSILAWKIPWTEESGGLHLMVSQRVGHDWALTPLAFTPQASLSSSLLPSPRQPLIYFLYQYLLVSVIWFLDSDFN